MVHSASGIMKPNNALSIKILTKTHPYFLRLNIYSFRADTVRSLNRQIQYIITDLLGMLFFIP